MALQKLCRVEDLPDGAGREFVVDGRIVAVFRAGEELHAIDGMCADQGGPIAQGAVDRNCVTCPWHGWQYDIRDGTNRLTGKQMLDCFAIELRSDEVWIDVSVTH